MEFRVVKLSDYRYRVQQRTWYFWWYKVKSYRRQRDAELFCRMRIERRRRKKMKSLFPVQVVAKFKG